MVSCGRGHVLLCTQWVGTLSPTVPPPESVFQTTSPTAWPSLSRACRWLQTQTPALGPESAAAPLALPASAHTLLSPFSHPGFCQS